MNKSQIIQQKILPLAELRRLIAGWRLQGRKIVFTNGCFDILHRGHIELLARAADLGAILIIGLNTDASVRRLKGSGRPVYRQGERAAILASLFFVDAVVFFEENTPELLIKALLPDVLVKGGDYTPDTVAGAASVTGNGGEVVIIPLVPGFSTTHTIQQVKDSK